MPINATVNYHVQSDEPQAFRFDVDGIIGNLISPELIATEVTVEDVRGNSELVRFEVDGVTFKTAPTQIKTFQSESDWEADYNDELTALLVETIGAKEVIIFDHTVRIDDPIATRKPARNVHNDYSQAGAEQRLVDLVGENRAQSFHEGSFGFVNVWRPVEHAIHSSPLGFIRPSSVDPKDWMDIELIYPDRLGQILGVAANDAHEWFYMSEMTPDEVAIFNIYDNRGGPHLAHSALDLPSDAQATIPRKSIESRTLVRYA